MYMAPELMAAQQASPRSDTYSLGVVLYQLAVGNLNQPLTSDWQTQIDDPLIREDISLCVKGNAAERISAGHLAELIRTRGSRLAQRQQETAAQRAREQRLYRLGILRAAAVASVVLLAVSVLTVIAVGQASKARDSARKEQAARQFAEQIVQKQMERTRLAEYTKVSQLLTDALAQYAGKKKINWGIETANGVFIRSQEYTSADGTSTTTVFFSAECLRLLDFLSRAAAVDNRKPGFLSRFIADGDLSSKSSLWFDPVVWDEDVLNESLSNFNGLCIFLMCLESQRVTIGDATVLPETSTLILRQASAQCLKSGAIPMIFFMIAKTLESAKTKPAWASVFSVPMLDAEAAFQLYKREEEAFFRGSL